MNGLELQIVQGLTGLLSLGVTAGIAYVAPRTRRWVSTHTTAKVAAMAATVIDGLSSIANTVVADFNQRVVADAKAAGTWTPALAASVKADAVKAVLSQGASLVALGKSVVGDVESLVPALVEQAVTHQPTYTPLPAAHASTILTAPGVSAPEAAKAVTDTSSTT